MLGSHVIISSLSAPAQFLFSRQQNKNWKKKRVVLVLRERAVSLEKGHCWQFFKTEILMPPSLIGIIIKNIHQKKIMGLYLSFLLSYPTFCFPRIIHCILACVTSATQNDVDVFGVPFLVTRLKLMVNFMVKQVKQVFCDAFHFSDQFLFMHCVHRTTCLAEKLKNISSKERGQGGDQVGRLNRSQATCFYKIEFSSFRNRSVVE